MNILKKLGINQTIPLKNGISLKPSESHLFWCIKKEYLKKLNDDYSQILESLIEMILFCDRIAFHPPYLEKDYKKAVFTVENLTGLKINEISKLLEGD